MNKQELKIREKIALDAIKASFGTENGEYGANLFVQHHLEELEKDYWEKQIGISSPTPDQVLNILRLKSHWDDEKIFDFTLPGGVTDYVLSVTFNESGRVDEIGMES